MKPQPKSQPAESKPTTDANQEEAKNASKDEATPSKHGLHDKETTMNWLKQNGINKTQTVDHVPVMTMDDMTEHVKFTGAFAKTVFGKNLFF